ncbi:MAG: hypothetical protein E7200_11500 [Selenomonas ruminantium]|nr:hypothetical protein [Selenomonas ruminantium]
METRLYIAEGETEEHFIKEMIRLKCFVPGKFRKFNLMQKQLKNTDNIMMKKYSRVICIIDTDCISDDEVEKLKANLKMLSGICSRLDVLVQNKNFEDELKRLLGKKNLLKAFPEKFDGLGELKHFLAEKIDYEKYIDKKKVSSYCSGSNEFKEELGRCLGKNKKIKIIAGENIRPKKSEV